MPYNRIVVLRLARAGDCSQAHLKHTRKDHHQQFVLVSLGSHICLRLLAIAFYDAQARTFLKGRAMVFIQQNSIGRSGEPSRLRDKLLLYNARTGLSQQSLARLVGVSTAALRNWEAGQSKPTAQNLQRLLELYIAYRAFAGGEERAEAAELWEAAQERGLKVPCDEKWFQELLATQRSFHRKSEGEHQPEQSHKLGLATEQDPHQEPGTEASDDRSSTENQKDLPAHPPEALPASYRHAFSRRTVVVGIACLMVGGTAGSSLTWAMLRSQFRLLPRAQWTQANNMLQPRSFFRATLLQTGHVLIEGGVLPDKTTTAQSDLFDPTRGTWRQTQSSLNELRAKHTATLLPGGMVLVTGGFGTKTRSSAELYDPRLETWASLPNMHFARADFTAALLPDGSLMVIGGRLQSGDVTQTTEIYNPDTRRWLLGASMNYTRLNPLGQEALQVGDGTILVVGGDTLGTSESYAPTTGTWVSPLRLRSRHYLGATASLNNGQAFVVGGFNAVSTDDKSKITDSTELYWPGSK
jgi:transcriptional regulator with XRE-family HTH domain